MKDLTIVMLILANLSGLVFANDENSSFYGNGHDKDYSESFQTNTSNNFVESTTSYSKPTVHSETTGYDQTQYYFPKHIKYLLLIILIIASLSIVWLYFRIGEVAEIQYKNSTQIDYLNRITRNIATNSISKNIESDFTQKTTNKNIPKVEFVQGVIEKMVNGINDFRNQHLDIETGYALIGNVVGSGVKRKIVVSGLVDAGPETQRSSGHVEFNRQYQQLEIEKMRLLDWNICHIGDSHLHPGSMDYCSGGDYETDRKNVINSRSKEMVFVIATKEYSRHLDHSKESMYVDGLKLDFFYLGADSNYEYRHFLPSVMPGDAIEINDSLRRFFDCDVTKVILDFDNLRRLNNFSYQLLDYPMDGGCASPCVELTHKILSFKVLIFFGDSTAEKPTVYIEVGDEIMEYIPDYLKDTHAEHVWFTQIALSAEQEFGKRMKHETDISQTKSMDIQPRSMKTA